MGTVLEGLQVAGVALSKREHTCCQNVEKGRYDGYSLSAVYEVPVPVEDGLYAD